MLTISFLPALGFTIGGVIVGIYVAYLLFGWALTADDEEYDPPSFYDENSYS